MNGYLIGVYECKVDSKARLMIPVQLKKQLGVALQSSFVIKRSVFHPCLELFTIESWNDMVKEINQLNRFVKKNNDFIRMFTAGVKLTELDSSGRLLIPRNLKSFATIETEIVLSSSGNMIEIWNKTNYEKTVSASESNFSKMAEEVMGNINSTSNE
tara:strand:+ start:72 stop:542 length:471 start_codon:yes stop_codon:yes gene_type:complete